MKRKLLFLMAMTISAFAWNAKAQTDVTSTYLTNADFSASTPIANDLRGYGKDMATGDSYGFQAVDGWTYVVVNGDNANASYPNSGMGAAVFQYGSAYQLKGNNVTAPAEGPETGSANGLGFFAVWSCGGYYYQDVTLPAGEYTLNIPMYCVSGTQANTSWTGFVADGGSKYTVAVNPAIGSWTTQTVNFTLAAETAGKICLGYVSSGAGSGANPHIFIDKVQILYKAVVVKDALYQALETAKKVNTEAPSTELAQAIEEAQAVYDNASATQEQVNDEEAYLKSQIMKALSAAGNITFLIDNPGFELSTAETTNWAAGAAPNSADYATTGWTLVQGAGWSSSAIVAYGGTGQVNGVSAPDADNAGNTGNALGISVGWNGIILYKSSVFTLPAGAYTLKVNAYNNNTATKFISELAFVPTADDPYSSNKTSFTTGVWEEDVVTFTLDSPAEGYIQIGGQGINDTSSNNAKVFFDNLTLEYKSFYDAAKDQLAEMLAKARSVVNVNVGDQPLQRPESARNTLGGKILQAQTVYDSDSSTKEQIEAQTASLQTAIDEFITATVNPIDNTKRFYLQPSTSGHPLTYNAVLCTKGATSANNPTGYGFNAGYYGPNVALAQAFRFQNTTGNNYIISVMTADGEVYLTNGDTNGSAAAWKNSQIQGTTDVSKALEFVLQASENEGSFNIINPATNTTVACQNGGPLYTEPGNADFTINEAYEASVFVGIFASLKYCTAIFPFVPTLPSGVKAYSCASLDADNVLILDETAEPKANEPYILYSEANVGEDIEGWGTGETTMYTSGLLTGTYEQLYDVMPETGKTKYVMQNQPEEYGVAFYYVQDGTVVQIDKYRCFLTVEGAGVKALKMNFDDATAIEAINALTEGTAEIYNAAGVRTDRLEKGMNIIRMSNGKVQKVMVK